jgi:hypothetical protein
VLTQGNGSIKCGRKETIDMGGAENQLVSLVEIESQRYILISKYSDRVVRLCLGVVAMRVLPISSDCDSVYQGLRTKDCAST